MGQPHGIAIIGLGVISRAYLETLDGHPAVKIVAVADLDEKRAADVAAEIGAVALSVDDAIAHPDVTTILNLTIPAAHAEIALKAIAQGKDVYTEKPLAANLDDARAVIEAARLAGTRVGSAPDTVLGTGVQTARAVVNSGVIGRVTGASATWVAAGHETWHPNPDFYYRVGGGPLLDMGPYYVSSLIHLLGPVVSVVGAGSRLRDTRVIATGPRAGESIDVEVLTHVTGILHHANGAISSVTTSFDGGGTQANPIEVYGESGALAVPDPNRFDGTVRVLTAESRQWTDVEPSAGFVDAARGLGLLEFLDATPESARASGTMGLHVLEVMTGLLDSAMDGRRVQMTTTVERPALVPLTPASVWTSFA